MVRRERGLRAAARRFGVSLSTVQRWVARAGGDRLDRVAFDARAPGQASNRTGASVEAQVLAARKRLAERSDLGERGAVAIRRELQRLKAKVLPPAGPAA